MKVGVVYNPKARANKKSDKWLSFWKSLEVNITILDEKDKLSKAVTEYSKEKYDLVFVSGGDGTVQCLQTEFGNLKPLSHIPLICLLPHGTTNMTAADVGLKSSTQESIRSILTRKDYLKRATNIKKRGTIKVDHVKDRPPQFGVFLGSGALYEAVRKFHQNKDNQKLTGHLATSKILITEIYRALFKQREPVQGIYKGYNIEAMIDGKNILDGEQLFLLISTLDKLILGSQPFWGRQNDGLKITSAAWPLKKNLLSTVYQIMFAQDRSSLREPEFVSCSAQKLELITSSGFFTMDGEIFEIEEDKALKISLGPEFNYLCG